MNVKSNPISAKNDAECTGKAYVTNSYADTVSVVDTTTDKVIATIPVDKAPVNPTFTPDGKQVYVANSQAGTLSVIDVKIDAVTATIQAGGPKPSGRHTRNGRGVVCPLSRKAGIHQRDSGWQEGIYRAPLRHYNVGD